MLPPPDLDEHIDEVVYVLAPQKWFVERGRWITSRRYSASIEDREMCRQEQVILQKYCPHPPEHIHLAFLEGRDCRVCGQYWDD